MTDTPEFRDRGKRTLELVVHRNFVTHYHFGTLELVTLVHQNKICIVRFGGRTPSWCEAVERDAFVVWHAITDELAECFACRAVGCFVVWHLRSVT